MDKLTSRLKPIPLRPPSAQLPKPHIDRGNVNVKNAGTHTGKLKHG